MTVITFTEAMTELAFGSRQTSSEVVRTNIERVENWTEQFRQLSIAANLAAAAVGRGLDYYRAPNPLIINKHPPAVIALFAACAAQEQVKTDAERASSGSARRLVEAAASGRISLFGRFNGQGESKAIPTHELYQLVFIPDFGPDVLTVRETWETWTHVLVEETTFGTWLDGERQRSSVRDQAETAIAALRGILSTDPKITVKAARALLIEQHGIDLDDEEIKRDLLPIARARSGLEPRGPGRPPKSGNGIRGKK